MTIEIETTRFGKLSVPEEQVITFDAGLIGFDGSTRFVLIHKPEHEPFHWLQSLDDGSLAFVMLEPELLEPEYRKDIRPDAVGDVWSDTPEDLVILAIATVPDKTEDTTVNLLGPIVINSRTRKAAQAILYSEKWHTRHAVFTRDEATGTDKAA